MTLNQCWRKKKKERMERVQSIKKGVGRNREAINEADRWRWQRSKTKARWKKKCEQLVPGRRVLGGIRVEVQVGWERSRNGPRTLKVGKIRRRDEDESDERLTGPGWKRKGRFGS